MSESITGVVERIFFRNPTTRFCAGLLRLSDPNQPPTTAFAGGTFVEIGETVTFTGEWTTHPKYGHQFKVIGARRQEKLDINGLESWLANNAAGLGSVKAYNVVQKLQDRFERVLIEDTEEFAEVARITVEQARQLKAAWTSRGNEIRVSTQLAAFGLTNHQTNVLIDYYGTDAARIVLRNPYILLRTITNFGWTRVDEIALKIGIDRQDDNRVAEGIRQAIHKVVQNGSTCIEENMMFIETIGLLTLDCADEREIIADRLTTLLEEPDGRVSRFEHNGQVFYAPTWLAEAEKRAFRFLRDGFERNPFIDDDQIEGLVERYSHFTVTGPDGEPQDSELDPSQKEALRMVATYKRCIISGQAGSGKTLLIQVIFRMMNNALGLSTSLAAPTGKAARRMEEVVGVPAQTIHKMLKYSGAIQGFLHNEEDPLPSNVVILDEASMIGLDLMGNLIDGLRPGACVILIGDHHQLPSISPGAILRDTLQHNLAPFHVLTKCHRQAGTLKRNSSAILDGFVAPSETNQADNMKPPVWLVHRKCETTDDVLAAVERLFTNMLPKWEFNPLREVQFMTPIHKGPIGRRTINQLIQRLHQATLGVEVAPVADERPLNYYKGDKVIQTRNDYTIGVMNGTIGYVEEIREEATKTGKARFVVVNFDGTVVEYASTNTGDIDLAYCLTPHKFQGSQIKCAIVVCHSAHQFMTNRNWLYTAATRAQETAIVIGNESGVKRAAEKVAIDQRLTLLPILEKMQND